MKCKFGNSRKGFYTAIIGTLVIFLVAVFLFNAMSYIETEKSRAYVNNTGEVKSRWLEARFVLDKVVSDAMADKAGENCSASQNYATIISAYFNNTTNQLNEKFSRIGCHSSTPATVNNNQEFDVYLECESKIETSEGVEFSATYEKSFSVHKTVAAQMSEGMCEVTVRDNQSGIYEVG